MQAIIIINFILVFIHKIWVKKSISLDDTKIISFWFHSKLVFNLKRKNKNHSIITLIRNKRDIFMHFQHFSMYTHMFIAKIWNATDILVYT